MAPPPLPPADSLPQKSTDNTALFIAFGVFGAISLIAAAIIALIINSRRNNSGARHSNAGHSHNVSDSSVTYLLQPTPQWREDSVTPLLDHSLISSDNAHRKDSGDSLNTIIPSRYETDETEFREATPLLPSGLRPPKPSIPPLVIPSNSSNIPSRLAQSTSESTEALSPDSASSESLYSQSSASTSHVATNLPERTPYLPIPPPPMVPQYAHTRPGKADVLAKSDTRRIGKLLKERAKKNERKLTRTISRIERAGSIKTAHNSDDSDDDSESVHRPHRPKTNRRPAVAVISAGAAEEWSNIALSAR